MTSLPEPRLSLAIDGPGLIFGNRVRNGVAITIRVVATEDDYIATNLLDRPVRLSLAGGTIRGGTIAEPVDGVATFHVELCGYPYSGTRLIARAAGYKDAEFGLRFLPGGLRALRVNQPGDVASGVPLNGLSITAVDACGFESPDPIFLDLAVELLPNPFEATLTGSLQHSGRVMDPVFADLRVHGVGTGLALRVTSSHSIIESATTGPFSTLPVPANPAFAFEGPFTVNGEPLSDWGGVHVMNEDGSGAVRITLRGEYPTWSPDGRKLLFGRNPRLFVVDFDGGNEMMLCENCYNGRWSPDGTSIAFSRRIDGSAEFPGPARIHVMSIDGADQRVLSPPDMCAFAPSFAPDGSRILFVGCDDDAGIYTMNADGEAVIRLTALAGWDPSYSPDGSRIVFSYSVSGAEPSAIWTMGADGSGSRRTTFYGNDYYPAWSPDGSRIVFTRYLPIPDVNNQKPYLHTMNPDGTGMERVSPHPGRMPSWRPAVGQP
jgi:hypothetical protein